MDCDLNVVDTLEEHCVDRDVYALPFLVLFVHHDLVVDTVDVIGVLVYQ